MLLAHRMARSTSHALALLALLAAAGCGGGGAATHVFVRDPAEVWVEAASTNGAEVVLPPGSGLHGVRILEGNAQRSAILSYATLVREPSGSITVDDRVCAPWPTSPLSPSGELRVMKRHGEPPFVSDGLTLRVAYVCTGRGHEKTEIDFVTPWTNVREVRVVHGEVEEVAQAPTHPALQHATPAPP